MPSWPRQWWLSIVTAYLEMMSCPGSGIAYDPAWGVWSACRSLKVSAISLDATSGRTQSLASLMLGCLSTTWPGVSPQNLRHHCSGRLCRMHFAPRRLAIGRCDAWAVLPGFLQGHRPLISFIRAHCRSSLMDRVKMTGNAWKMR